MCPKIVDIGFCVPHGQILGPCFVQHKLKVGDLQRNINAKNFQKADDTIVYDHAYISDICPGICQPWINALSV